MIKEIPILFSTPMVQAILEGRKTQTRRIMKPQPDFNVGQIIKPGDQQFFHPGEEDGWRPSKIWALMEAKGTNGGCLAINYKCPFGKPGDIIWVRENYKIEGSMSHGESVLGVLYQANGYWKQNDSKEVFNLFHSAKSDGWRPSIHLPKVAARIWLQVESVRVERLQEITEADAIAEGVEKLPGSGSSTRFNYKHYDYELSYNVDAKVSFRTLWEKINGADSWQANPWVWVINFIVLSTTGKPDLNTL